MNFDLLVFKFFRWRRCWFSLYRQNGKEATWGQGGKKGISCFGDPEPSGLALPQPCSAHAWAQHVPWHVLEFPKKLSGMDTPSPHCCLWREAITAGCFMFVCFLTFKFEIQVTILRRQRCWRLPLSTALAKNWCVLKLHPSWWGAGMFHQVSCPQEHQEPGRFAFKFCLLPDTFTQGNLALPCGCW